MPGLIFEIYHVDFCTTLPHVFFCDNFWRPPQTFSITALYGATTTLVVMQYIQNHSLMRLPKRTASLDDYVRKPKQRSKLSRELQEYEERDALEKVNDMPVHHALPVIFVSVEAQKKDLSFYSHQSRSSRVLKLMNNKMC